MSSEVFDHEILLILVIFIIKIKDQTEGSDLGLGHGSVFQN